MSEAGGGGMAANGEQAALELRALQRVIASGARALDLDVVLGRCLEQAMAVARADAGTLYLRDPRRGNYRLAASRNTSPEFAPPPLTVDDRPEDGHPFFDHVVVLSVDTPNEQARRFYERLGFVDAARTLRIEVERLLA